MIALKYWNSLEQSTRSEICKALGKSGQIEYPYHHNFDYDALGKKLKSVLEACNIQPGGDIKVAVMIKPKVAKTKTFTVTPKPQPQNQTASRPKRWKFRRYTQSDPNDGEWVWAHGYTEEEARAEVMHDYWDTTKLECHGLID